MTTTQVVSRREIFCEKVLSDAQRRGVVIHEEIQTVALRSTEKVFRYTAILPDTRLCSVLKYQPRDAALVSLCVALWKELPKFDETLHP